MGFSYRTLICGGRTFCCCLPVRMGVISMSILGCLVAGILMILLWFQVSISGRASPGYAAIVIAALMETILLFASMLGLLGSLLRHRTLVKIYAYIIYTHFILNFAAAAYLIIKILQASQAANLLACQVAIQDPQAQGQCSDLLTTAKWVIVVVAVVVLSIELYGGIVVTRYLNQLEHEKSSMRSSRMDTELAFRAQDEHRYMQIHDPSKWSSTLGNIDSPDDEYDPYIEHGYTSPRDAYANSSQSSSAPKLTPRSNSVSKSRQEPSIEEGYGGGTWTHADVASDEKKLQEQKNARAYGDPFQPADHIDSEFVVGEGDAAPVYTPSSK